MLTTELVETILAAVPGRTVGLVGDLFLDRYFDIDAALNEPSVETGLTAYQVTNVRCYPGALGTVLNNLAALGVGRIHPITVIGDDGEGYELRKALAKLPAVVADDIVVSPDRRTPTYSKPMLNEAGAVRELNRLDIKNRTRTPAAIEEELLRRIDATWDTFDAVIVLDQVSEAECGVVTTCVRERLAELGERDPTKFVLADSRERIGLFRNVCVKPNERECRIEQAQYGIPRPHEHPAEYMANGCGRWVFSTNGADGIVLAHPDQDGIVHIPAYPVSGPIDICGAGDSCSAGIACAMTAGVTPEQAAAFGNLVASITVQQIGITGTAMPEQVRARWREVNTK
jgi:bifunctional ADP-heptose synthase (sugar kinase/adenylyltransferase)